MEFNIDRDEQPCIVQLQHCKDEIGISSRNSVRLANGNYSVNWNNGGHRRRLVGHWGKFATPEEHGEGELAFWTEWEAKTIAHRLRPLACDMCAKRIHHVLSPICEEVSGKIARVGINCADRSAEYLNTDPCVFGDSFKYSFCKQDAALGLKRLPPGSLIVFGSIHREHYYLDTVFVVADNPVVYETSAAGVANIDCSDEYRKLTLERLVCNAPGEYAFYRGVSFENGAHEPFSFTPAYRFSSDRKKSQDCYDVEANLERCRKRCRLDLQRLNAAAEAHGDLVRNPFDILRTRPTTITSANLCCVKAVWNDIVQQVTSQGFVLGVHLGWPEK